MAMAHGKTSRRALSAAVWAMGLGPIIMDTSSQLIHALRPLFLAGTLGASMLTIGLIEGIAEATAAVTRVFSGTLSDRLGQRKPRWCWPRRDNPERHCGRAVGPVRRVGDLAGAGFDALAALGLALRRS